MALQMDGVAEVTSSRKPNDAPTRGGRGFDGSVDGGCVHSLTITGGPQGSYVESVAARRVGFCHCPCGRRLNCCASCQRRTGDPGSRQLQEISSLRGLGEHDFFLNYL